MTQAPQVPPGADPEIPAPARMYGCFLGGTRNLASGRAAAGRVRELTSGSYLALPHVTDEKTPYISVRVAGEMYARASENLCFRSRAGVERFFAGLQLVSPCPSAAPAVHTGGWGAGDPAPAGPDSSHGLYCGAGRCP